MCAMLRQKSRATSYDDFVGILTNLGVITALMLSFVVGVQTSIDQDMLDNACFFKGVTLDKPFCKYATQVLLSTDFNSTILVDVDKYENILSECPMTSRNAYFIMGDFPMHYMWQYKEHHNEGFRCWEKTANTNNQFQKFFIASAMGTSSLTLSLTMAVVAYFVLTCTDANPGDEKTSPRFEKFTSYFYIFTGIGHALCLLGCMSFYFQLEAFSQMQYQASGDFMMGFMFAMLIPGTIIILPYGAFAYWKISEEPKEYKLGDENVEMQTTIDASNDIKEDKKSTFHIQTYA